MKFPHLVAVCATFITTVSLVLDSQLPSIHAADMAVTDLMHFDNLR